jgi:hypothetical protein
MANPYKTLISLLPKTRQGYGRVTAHNADGTSTVQTPAGGVVRARGQSVPVGNNAYWKDGEITAAAAAMQSYSVTV